ncbi:8-amino-7-oxononanoate synthase [Flavobacteriaceae bacterium TP-CH-4]|uniref:8-amino-7-oxononanoate synthase n=1 Tax=Pelagihabitans pacificus TaxID=2696054 RepID=A0A967E9T3_9FLAO|nr:8-amino-7-oxononanoate synthase [Pelagihabitans pacificus]NHF58771.1 8-amino-7-oxononanoate synthase [Pelagihabitans pacificus]
MLKIPKKLQQKLSERQANHSLRGLPVINDGLVDFSSNDYLGLGKNEAIADSALKIFENGKEVQNGATGSRLLSGNHGLYATLEKALSNFHEAEAALVFNSGYDANLGFFGCVPQRGDLVFYDELVHASIRDGIKIGNAKSYKFKHNDIEDLKSALVRSRAVRNSHSEIYIVTESVFSMDGDSPNLSDLAAFCRGDDHRLVVDEAHAVGVIGNKGEGLVQQLGLQNDVFARVVTFGKAIGCHGAAILGSHSLIDYLINFARSFIYTTGLPPHSVATILAAYRLLNGSAGAHKRRQLIEAIECFNTGLDSYDLKNHFIPSSSAIHCCIVPEIEKVREITDELQKKGFDVKPILSPTVPKGQERLRFCLHAYNSQQQISEVLAHLSTFIIRR